MDCGWYTVDGHPGSSKKVSCGCYVHCSSLQAGCDVSAGENHKSFGCSFLRSVKRRLYSSNAHTINSTKRQREVGNGLLGVRDLLLLLLHTRAHLSERFTYNTAFFVVKKKTCF